MNIRGACHCGNMSYQLDWPGEMSRIPVRACGCDFCTMRGATYTSRRDASLDAVIYDPDDLSKYRFGTETADFYVCSRCGAVPFVTSRIEGRLYAVVNVHTFQNIDRSVFQRAETDFDGESTENRLDRRARTWIPKVAIREGGP